MSETVGNLLALPYHITLVRDEDIDGLAGWVASVAELPGCLAQGDSPEDAAAAIRETMAIWFETMLEDGKPIPPPAPEPSASGRILARLPATLHERLLLEAEREGVSLNQLVVGILAGAVGWKTGVPPAGRDLPRSA